MINKSLNQSHDLVAIVHYRETRVIICNYLQPAQQFDRILTARGDPTA